MVLVRRVDRGTVEEFKLEVDPDIQKDKTKAEDLMAWEVFRIFYHGVVAAHDSADWPAPKAGFDLSGLTNLLQSALPKVLAAVGS